MGVDTAFPARVVAGNMAEAGSIRVAGCTSAVAGSGIDSRIAVVAAEVPVVLPSSGRYRSYRRSSLHR